MSELLLTVDTATPLGALAVTRGEMLLAERRVHTGTGGSERLLAGLEGLMADAGVTLAALDALAVVRGPGSFTGLRVGMGLVQGLALALAKPVLPVSSLAALALQAGETRHPVWALIDARKGEVYAAAYRRAGSDLVALTEELALTPAALADRVEGAALFAGSGVAICREALRQKLGEGAEFPLAGWCPSTAIGAAVLALGLLRSGGAVAAEDLRPVYVRQPDARLPEGASPASLG